MIPATRATIKVKVTVETGFGMKTKTRNEKMEFQVPSKPIANFEQKLHPDRIFDIDKLVDDLEEQIGNWGHENGKYVADYDGEIYETLTDWLAEWQEYYHPEAEEEE